MSTHSSNFNLERAITSWRHVLHVRGTFVVDDLDELEDHLRGDIQRLVDQGLSEKEAFYHSSEGLGNQTELETAFEPLRFGKHKRKQNLKTALLLKLSMFRHYIHVASRNMKRNLGQTFLTMLGLSIAISTCLFIVFYIQYELGFDTFHADSDRIYRVVQESDSEQTAMLSASSAPYLETTVAGVENSVRIFKHWEAPYLSTGSEGQVERQFIFADSSFFGVFSFELLIGDEQSALAAPGSVVISASTAKRYFGNSDPLGQTIQYNVGHTLTVTGVMADIPDNSHLHADFVTSMVTLSLVSYSRIMEEWSVFYTYVTMSEGLSRHEATSTSIPPAQANPIASASPATLRLQPLTDIHLHSHLPNELEPNGNYQYIFLLAIIGIFILLIASINHVNLATARALQRAKEVAIRKVSGARRQEVVGQFYVETILTIGLSLVLSVILLVSFYPALTNLVGTSVFPTTLDLPGVGVGLGLVLTLILLSGSYPALFLSRYSPSTVLRGAFVRSKSGKSLRNLLVLAQFTTTAVLITLTLTVTRQMNLIGSADLGFESQGVVVLPINGQEARQQVGALKASWMNIAGVSEVGITASAYPGLRHSAGHDVRRSGEDVQERLDVQRNWVDSGYFETLNIQIKEGQGFDMVGMNDKKEIILNEEAALALGWSIAADAVGQELLLNADTDPEPWRIVGIVSNFNFESLHTQINPLVFTPSAYPTHVLVQLGQTDQASTLALMENDWQQITNQPFSYSYLDEELQSLYAAESWWVNMLNVSTLLALIIACIGLVGLAAFVVETKTKEIGIRKTFGAGVAGILVLVAREFVYLILFAAILAVPISIRFIDSWLASFAYRTELGMDLFVYCTLILLVVGLCTIAFHAAKAATMSPVRSLKSE